MQFPIILFYTRRLIYSLRPKNKCLNFILKPAYHLEIYEVTVGTLAGWGYHSPSDHPTIDWFEKKIASHLYGLLFR